MTRSKTRLNLTYYFCFGPHTSDYMSVRSTLLPLQPPPQNVLFERITRILALRKCLEVRRVLFFHPSKVLCRAKELERREDTSQQAGQEPGCIQQTFSMNYNELGTFVWMILVAKHDRKTPWTYLLILSDMDCLFCHSLAVWSWGRSFMPMEHWYIYIYI